MSNCTPGAPAARASGWKATCWARAPESHKAATTLAALRQAMPAPSGQAHYPRTCPNPPPPTASGLAGHCTPHHWAEKRGMEKRGGGGRGSLLEPSLHHPWQEKVVPGDYGCTGVRVYATHEPFPRLLMAHLGHLHPDPSLQAQKSCGERIR